MSQDSGDKAMFGSGNVHPNPSDGQWSLHGRPQFTEALPEHGQGFEHIPSHPPVYPLTPPPSYVEALSVGRWYGKQEQHNMPSAAMATGSQKLWETIRETQESGYAKFNRRDTGNHGDNNAEAEAERTAWIKVSSIPDGVTEEELSLYFTNKRQHGGGDVNQTNLDTRQHVAFVEFAEAKAVQRVLNKCPLLMREKRITVEKFVPEKESAHTSSGDVTEGCIVRVTGQPPNTDKELLTLYFENSKKSGGGDIDKLEFAQDGSALITFADPQVARRVVEKTDLTLSSAHLTASLWQKPVPQDSKTIRVAGLNSSTSEEMLSLFFENAKKSGGGDIKEVVLREDCTALVTFEEEDIVHRVLSRGDLQLEGCTLEVYIHEQSVVECKTIHVSGMVPNIAAEMVSLVFENEKKSGGGELEKIDVKSDGTAVITFQDVEGNHGDNNAEAEAERTAWIKVSSIPDGVTEEELSLYFTNKRRHGGGDISRTNFDTRQHVAFIEFAEAKAVQRVLNKCPLLMREKRITVEKFVPEKESAHTSSGDVTEGCIVRVTGQTPNTDKELLTLYFENTKKSGGGDIDKLEFTQDGSALITFADPQVARRVVEKTDLALSSAHLTASLWQKPVPQDSKTIRVAGLNSSTSEEMLSLFFENAKKSGGGDIKEVVLREDGTALVTFEEEDILHRVLSREDLQLEGRTLEVYIHEESVIECKTIHVSGMVPNIAAEMVSLFFENEKKSGGGELEKIDVKSDGTAVIAFQDVGGNHGDNNAEAEAERTAWIKVSSIPDGVTEEELSLYFTNKRRHGGGDISRTNFDARQHVAFIEFAEAKAVQRVLNKCPLLMREKRITVEKFVPEKESAHTSSGDVTEGCIVRVTGQTPNIDKELLTLYFENTKKSGGGDIDKLEFAQDGSALITFADPQVARRVVEKTDLTLSSAHLTASLWQKPVSQDSKTISVAGLNSSTSEEMLSLFFENAKKSGGGDIKEVVLRDLFVGLLGFVVHRVLSRGDLQLEGCTLEVYIHEQSVVECKTIHVSGMVPNIAAEMVSLFFENEKKSGGGELEKIDVKSDGTAVITFQDVGGNHGDNNAEPEAERTAWIKVSSIPDGVTEEELSLYFTNKRRHGGGDISRTNFDARQHVAFIEFAEAKAVQRVLNKCPLLMREKRITVEKFVPEKESAHTSSGDVTEGCIVRVTGQTPNIDKELLTLYFENSKKSGGGDIDKLEFAQDGSALITFADPQVARRVVEKTDLTLNSAHLTASLWQKPVPQDSKTIRVAGLKSSTSEEMLSLFFENAKKSGGGDIKEVVLREDGTALVTFEEEDIVHRVLSRGDLLLEGCTLEVYIHEQSVVECKTIHVSGMVPNIAAEMVSLFFENEKKSGGGELEKIDVKSDGTAVITFQDVGVTHRVLEKDCLVLGGKRLAVSLWNPQMGADKQRGRQSADSPVIEDRIQVSGLTAKISEYSLLYYFENKRRSSGGDIKNIKLDKEKGVAFITFVDPTVVPRVVEKHDHMVEQVRLEVMAHRPPPPIPSDPNKVFLEGIKPETTEECLKLYIENRCDLEPQRIITGEKPGTRMLIFDQAIDVNRLSESCRQKALEGSFLAVSSVPVSNCIRVTNFIPATTRDAIMYYFENKRKSGGGNTAKCIMFKDEGYCLVYFDDFKVIGEVITRKHSLGGQRLDICVHYDGLGLVSIDGTEMPVVLPDPVLVPDINSYLLDFFQRSSSHQQALNAEILQVHGDVEWPTKSGVPLKIHCSLTKDMKDIRKLVPGWKKSVLAGLKSFLQFFLVKEVACLQETWPKIKAWLQEDKMVDLNEGGILVMEDSQYKVVIAGHDAWVSDYHRRVEEIKKSVEDELERQKVIKEKKSLKYYQVMYLNAVQFPDTIRTKYQQLDVKLNYQHDEVDFTGLPKEITNAQLAMYEKIKRNKMTVSPCIIELMQKSQTKKYLSEKLKQKSIQAVWDIQGSEVSVFAPTDKEIVEGTHIIKNSLAESVVQINAPPFLKSSIWISKVQELEKLYAGVLKIIPTSDNSLITIVAIDDIIKGILEILNDLLKANTILTEFSQLDLGTAEFIAKYKLNEIRSLNKSLQTCKVEIQIAKSGYKSGISLRGTEDGVDQAKQKLEQLTGAVKSRRYHINKPGIPKYLLSSRGNDFISTVEQKCSCIIRETSKQDFVMVDNRSGAPRIRASVSLPKNRKILAVVGDMTEYRVDAIVNVANRRGLADAIVKKEDSIQKEYDHYVKSKGRIKDGEVAITGAGNLLCKAIIHAVSPVWKGGGRSEEDYLQEAVMNSLHEASHKGFTSIAIPAINTGEFGYPMSDAVQMIVESVKNYFKEEPASSLREVHLIDVSEQTVQQFIITLINIYGKQDFTMLADNPAQPSPLWDNLRWKKTSWLGGSEEEGAVGGLDQPKIANSIVLVIISDNDRSIDQAIEKLDEMCKSEREDKLVTKPWSETISNLTDEQVARIYDIENEHGVELTVEKEYGSIRMQGMPADVMATYEKLTNIFKEVQDDLHSYREAEVYVSLIQWYFMEEDESAQRAATLTTYHPTINKLIEDAFQNKRPCTVLEDAGCKYIFNFDSMTEYPVKHPEDAVKLVRKTQITGSGGFQPPPSWKTMDNTANLEVVPLQPADSEYQTVVNNLHTQMAANVIKVERIQNRSLYEQYLAHKGKMERGSSGTTIEKTLWHGTSAETVPSINSYGFNRSYCGKNATMFGNGVYFAVNATYSASATYARPDNQGHKRMYLTKVLVGAFTQGRQGMIVPPAKSRHILYDSVVDNPSTPGMYIIFHDTQAYPEYLITFT